MTQKAQFLAKTLEQIGAPLLGALVQADGKEEAQHIATLLSRSVQLSIEIGKLIDIDKADAGSVEALRVTLASLASPIVAASFKSTGHAPTEAELGKIITSLESVMAFSDNFMPSEEQEIRMDKIEATGIAVDGYQANIQYIHALSPIVDAIASFSFGQQEKKLALDVCNRLVNEAKSVRRDQFVGLDGEDAKRVELALLRSFGDIYAACHKNAVADLMAIAEPSPDAQTQALQNVWDDFDRRAAMIGVLAQSLVPGVPTSAAPQSAASSSSAAPAAPQAPATQTEQPVAPSIPPQEIAPSAAPAQPVAATPTQVPQTPPATAATAPPLAQSTQQQGGGYNPMSMFGAPKQESEAAPAAPQAPAAPPAAPPVQPEQPVTPPIPPQENAAPTAPAQPLATPPAQEQGDGSTEGGESSQGGGGGNPMSFFKKGD